METERGPGQSEPPRQTWLSEGTIIAAVPALGFLLAYCYEAGYGSYFDIPTAVIDLSIVNIVAALLGAAIYFWFAFLYLQFTSLMISSTNKVVQGLGSLMATLALSAFLVIFTGTWSPWAWIAFGALLLVMAVDLLALPLFLRGESDYLARVAKRIQRHARGRPKVKLEGILGIYENVEQIITLSIIAVAGAYFSGATVAHNEAEFWVLDGKSTVVLRRYGDLMVMKDFQPKTLQLCPGTTIMRVADGQSIQIAKRHLPLASARKRSTIFFWRTAETSSASGIGNEFKCNGVG